jgi:lipopolysaccharide export system ATP-binding protein
MSELVIENLKKTFKKRTVVQDVSLTIKSGEIVGLLGPNGAGKTTSFYMIVGLIPNDRGRISLDGANISKMPIHSRAKLGLSYLPQEPSIFRKMTVAENILAILEIALQLAFPGAKDVALKLLDALLLIPHLFFWMNLLQALIQLRSLTFKKSLNILPNNKLVFLLQIIMFVKL